MVAYNLICHEKRASFYMKSYIVAKFINIDDFTKPAFGLCTWAKEADFYCHLQGREEVCVSTYEYYFICFLYVCIRFYCNVLNK